MATEMVMVRRDHLAALRAELSRCGLFGLVDAVDAMREPDDERVFVPLDVPLTDTEIAEKYGRNPDRPISYIAAGQEGPTDGREGLLTTDHLVDAAVIVRAAGIRHAPGSQARLVHMDLANRLKDAAAAQDGPTDGD
jgi:hypothetical protein